MKYKKEYIKSNGRKLIGGGPRDIQRRQRQSDAGNVDHTDTIKELKDEIKRLTTELHERPVIGGFTGEQVDKEIRNAVTEAINDLKKEIKDAAMREKELVKEIKSKDKELEKTRDKHSKEIANLLKEHNKKLEELTTSLLLRSQNGEIIEDVYDDRPKMKTVFIDPLEENSGKSLESHVGIKDVSINEKENMFEKVDKLKGMLGKLPTKK